MARTASEYAVHIFFDGGIKEEVRFPTMKDFQTWYSGELMPKATSNEFIKIPIKNVEGEYMVARPSKIMALRVEPVFTSSVERW